MKVKALFVLILCSGLFLLSSCSKNKEGEKGQAKEEAPSVFHDVTDIVINPAGTNAQRVMLVSLALQVKSEDEKKKLEEGDARIRDVIVTSLSSKSIDKLTEVGYKDSLKAELKSKLKTSLHDVSVKDIFFTKYIIQ